MNNRTPEEAIKTIRSNWPDERYTMLRESLEYAITAIEDNAKLVKALEWYGDEENYVISNFTDYDVEPVVEDGGQRARECIAKLGGERNE